MVVAAGAKPSPPAPTHLLPPPAAKASAVASADAAAAGVTTIQPCCSGSRILHLQVGYSAPACLPNYHSKFGQI